MIGGGRTWWVYTAGALLLAACSSDTQPRDAAVDHVAPAPDLALSERAPDRPGDRPRGDAPRGDQGKKKEAGPDLPDLPGNSACWKAQAVTLTGGAAHVTGTTSGLVNEFGGGVKCGADLVTPLPGPQAYYSIGLTGGKTYLFTVSAGFTGGSFYLFSQAAGCTASGLEKDCQSSGSTGFKLTSLGSTPKTYYFSSKTAGVFLFAVDGTTAGQSGSFTVDIQEYQPASNGTCANATPITLTSGRATIQGNTYGGADEFAGQLKCGGYTAFAGPQLYYSLYVGAGKSYKLKLTPSFNAYLYVFSDSAGCSPAPINQYCGSAGATGALVGSISSGTSKAIVFSPFPPAGNYIIAVDSQGAGEAGAFTLEVEDFTPAANGTCAGAQPIALSGGKASVSGSTLGLADENPALKCGGYTAFNGPQAYYTIGMTAGKAYRIDFVPSGFSGYLYIFSSAAACAANGIETDCASKGATGDKWGPYSSTASVYFVPGQSGTYTLAVDGAVSTYTSFSGDFTLDVTELTPPGNGSCATAQAITLSGGKASVSGSTVGTKDEFSTLKCGGYTAFAGPQAYYSLAMSQTKIYKVVITPTGFNPYFYIFSDSAACTQSSIESSCASKGVSGGLWGSIYSKATAFFTPASSGAYLMAVDSSSTSAQGEFTLDFEELPAPVNGTCATAQTLAVTPGTPTSVSGITFGAKDELSTLKCGGYTSFAGPQVYYKVDLKAGLIYKITLEPGFSSAYAYIFPAGASCQQAAIETACASKGATGDMWGPMYSTTSHTFSPTVAGTYIIGIDSSSSSYSGTFTLTVE
jgi:hypothetical protein